MRTERCRIANEQASFNRFAYLDCPRAYLLFLRRNVDDSDHSRVNIPRLITIRLRELHAANFFRAQTLAYYREVVVHEHVVEEQEELSPGVTFWRVSFDPTFTSTWQIDRSNTRSRALND